MRASTNRDRIRCFKCRKYNHFTKDCPHSETEREPEQIQQMYNLDENQIALKVLVADTYKIRWHYRSLKLIKGKNGTTTFFTLNTKIDGPVKCAKDKEIFCLTKDHARHIYKKVKLECVANVDTIKQEIEEDKLYRDNINDDAVNPYHNMIINNIDRENVITSQMEQWPILSNTVNCVQYEKNPKN